MDKLSKVAKVAKEKCSNPISQMGFFMGVEWAEQQESEKKCILCKYYQPDLLKCDNLGLKSYSVVFEKFHCCYFIEDNDRKYKPKKTE